MKSPRTPRNTASQPGRAALRPPSASAHASPVPPRRTVRRSFALPSALVEKVSEAAPPEYRGNLNGVVRLALEEFVARRERDAFEREMVEMADEPGFREKVRAMSRDMEGLDDQGLPRP